MKNVTPAMDLVTLPSPDAGSEPFPLATVTPIAMPGRLPGGSASADGEAMTPELHHFLTNIANTPMKVQVLALFMEKSGICLSSDQMAVYFKTDQETVRAALLQLGNDGILTYCPYFGNADLCMMNPNYHTSRIKRDLRLLATALQSQPQMVWQLVGAPPTA